MIFYEHKTHDFSIFKTVSFSFPPHLHKHIEIFVCTYGNIDVTCNFKKESLSKNMWMIALPEQEHSYSSIGDGHGILMLLNPSLVPGISLYLNKEPENPFIYCDNKLLFNCLNTLLNEPENTMNHVITKGCLYVILGTLFKKCHFLDKKDRLEENIIFKILTYITQNFRSAITLSGIAKQFGLNYSYLSRMFKGKIGCSFHEYLHELRIDYAKYLLSNTALPIVDVYFECGFSTQRSFNRVFLEFAHCTPTGYRKNKYAGN